MEAASFKVRGLVGNISWLLATADELINKTVEKHQCSNVPCCVQWQKCFIFPVKRNEMELEADIDASSGSMAPTAHRQSTP